MRKWITILLTLSLALGFPAIALAEGQGDSGTLVKPGSSNISDLFSQMQNQLAEQSKITSSVSDQMHEITEKQKEESKVSDYVDQARELQDQAKDKEDGTKIPDDLKDYMDKNGLQYDHNNGSQNRDQWNTTINSLEDHRDQIGTDIQKEMVDVQDMMGKFNSYTPSMPSLNNGSQAPKEMQTLDSTTRGQSLFSTSGTEEMKTAPIATSLVIGAVLGMVAMWLIQRSKNRRGRAK